MIPSLLDPQVLQELLRQKHQVLPKRIILRHRTGLPQSPGNRLVNEIHSAIRLVSLPLIFDLLRSSSKERCQTALSGLMGAKDGPEEKLDDPLKKCWGASGDGIDEARMDSDHCDSVG